MVRVALGQEVLEKAHVLEAEKGDLMVRLRCRAAKVSMKLNILSARGRDEKLLLPGVLD